MTPLDRRLFLKYLSGTAVTTTFMESIAKATAVPAFSRTGTIDDVKHVVILMQENRAFDHYFGTMRGVRGFGDPHPATLPSGKPVWYQPNGTRTSCCPSIPRPTTSAMQYLVDTAHDWNDTHDAWNGGKYDQWIPTKSPQTMAYYTRRDIPFHYALADAFTICDGYHCSFLGATDPNRYHMWTGWVGNDGLGGGPVINNAEAGYDWSTYPERLERAGISWKIYQDSGIGLDANGTWGWTSDPFIGNYGDNSLLYFHQYQNALPGSPLYEKARRGTNIAVPGTPFDALFDDLRKDVRQRPVAAGVVDRRARSFHRAWQLARELRRLVHLAGARCAHLESRGLEQDRVVRDVRRERRLLRSRGSANAAAHRRRRRIHRRCERRNLSPAIPTTRPGPYGLGVRVPMIVVSPWSKGGWVCSEVFDHTSLIRFLERRFAPHHPGSDRNQHHAAGAGRCAAI